MLRLKEQASPVYACRLAVKGMAMTGSGYPRLTSNRTHRLDIARIIPLYGAKFHVPGAGSKTL